MNDFSSVFRSRSSFCTVPSKNKIHIVLRSVHLPLKENQIVCLEYESNNLYGEVIQLIPLRQLCWFRPLCLIISVNQASRRSPFVFERSPKSFLKQQKYSSELIQSAADSAPSADKTELIDMRFCSDLLWPKSLFRPALDTEIIHLLPQLKDISHPSPDKTLSQKYLSQFIHLVWQAHQDKF